MFDDQPIAPAGGSVPPNLPTAEPPDMFGGVEPVTDVPVPQQVPQAAPPQPVPQVVTPQPAPIPQQPVPPPSPAPLLPPQPESVPGAVPPAGEFSSALGAGALRPVGAAESDLPPDPMAGQLPPQPQNTVPYPSQGQQQSPPLFQSPGAPQQGQYVPPGSGGGVPPANYNVKGPSIGKAIITVIATILILGILGGGGWLVYTKFIVTPDDGDFSENLPVDTGVVDTSDTGGITIQVTEDPEPAAATDSAEVGTETDIASDITDDRILFGEPVDKDGDGLEDDREVELGTDPNNWDSDGDDLSDGDEIIVWKTDPLNPDTDGDSFEDGEEIKNGFRPDGDGRIFEVPAEDEGAEVSPTTEEVAPPVDTTAGDEDVSSL